MSNQPTTKTLTYWVAECLNDAPCYSFRAKTKKECAAKLAANWTQVGYGPVHKVTVNYTDAFDLLVACVGEEGGLYEGDRNALAQDLADAGWSR